MWLSRKRHHPTHHSELDEYKKCDPTARFPTLLTIPDETGER
jgi:hypothetical protein